MSNPHAAFFDVGDTLVFDDPPIALRFAEAARSAGYAVDSARLPEAWHRAERTALDSYLAGTDTDDLDVQRRSASSALVALGYPAPDDAHWRDLAGAFAAVPFVRGVPAEVWPLLEGLRARGILMGIISDWENTLPAVLEELGLAPYFQTVSISSCVGYRKPDPRLFAHALMQANVPAADALHIGDWWELDVQGARSVGLPALLFDHAGRSPQAGCPRAETFDALAAYLEQWAAPRTR